MCLLHLFIHSLSARIAGAGGNFGSNVTAAVLGYLADYTASNRQRRMRIMSFMNW